MRTNIDNNKKSNVGRSGNDIKIIGTTCFSSTARKETLNYQLLKIILIVMVII
jgi:hypothetical protein